MPVTVDKTPGWYAQAIDVTISFPPGVRKAILTTDDRSPVLSEVLAYDRGPYGPTPVPPAVTPPDEMHDRPAMAVTQDGRGNVFYDAGFPKYYNQSPSSPIPATFEELIIQWKIMYNAIKFCTKQYDPPRLQKKALLIGNTDWRTSAYPLKLSLRNPVPGQAIGSGFKDTFTDIFNVIGNYTVDWQDNTDYAGGVIDLRFQEMLKYDVILFMASTDSGVNYETITRAMCEDLARYRLQGGGLIIVTDHGAAWQNSVEEAVAFGRGFAGDATKVASHYGAYFTGVIDSQPLNIGEVRAQLALNGGPGDHPLLNGLTNDMTIPGMESLSLVRVNEHKDDIIDHTKPYTTRLSKVGSNRLNVLLQMADGSISVQPFLYNIVDTGGIYIQDYRSRNLGTTVNSVKRILDLRTHYQIPNAPTCLGKVLKNGVIIGAFELTTDAQGNQPISVTYIGGTRAIRLENNDVITYRYEYPFIYEISTTYKGEDTTSLNKSWPTIPGFSSALVKTTDYSGLSPMKALRDFWGICWNYFRDSDDTAGSLYGIWPRIMRRFPRGLSGRLSNLMLTSYSNNTQFMSERPTAPAQGFTAWLKDTNELYVWWEVNNVGQWYKHPQLINVMFEKGRRIQDQRDLSWTVVP